MQQEKRDPAVSGEDPITQTERPSLLRSAAVVCAAVAAPVNLRLAEITATGGSLAMTDMRGLAADLGISLLVAFALGWALTARRKALGFVVATAVMAGWLVLNLGNHEHILALGSMVNWVNAGFLLNRSFLLGSALHISQPVLVTGICAASVLLLLLGSRSGLTRKQWAVLPVASLIVLAMVALLPKSPVSASWRQTHFVLENLHWLANRPTLKGSDEPIPGIYPGDLDGQPVVARAQGQPDVLLVILEGVSGAYLDSIAELHGFEGDRPRLPALDAVARRGYTLSNFINHQRQTNRGVYSLVCGDLPKQITAAPKMSEVAFRREVALCLPEALRRKGYETVFLQAARLDFMGKDKFMPRAGYSRYFGRAWFAESSDAEIGEWGVDDREFFRRSLGLIHELEQGPDPWFLTLLTSGTHHPFMVPDDFQSGSPDGTFAHAVDYLNIAVGEFLAGLETLDLERDTLIIFASDESFGLEGDLDDDSVMLSQAWGFLTVLLPSKEQGMVHEPFMQSDVALSVLDYLGDEASAAQFRGRSIFRTYSEPRAVPFANTYMRMVGALSPRNELVLCGEDFATCRGYQLADTRRVFGARTLLSQGPGDIDFLKAVAARAQISAVDREHYGEKTWPLVDVPQLLTLEKGPGAGGPEMVKVFGDQYLALSTSQRVDIDMEVEVTGTSDVVLLHFFGGVAQSRMPSLEEFKEGQKEEAEYLKLGPSLLGTRPQFAKNGVLLLRTQRLVRSGETFQLSYSYETPEDLVRLNALLFAATAGPGRVELEVTRAMLRITDVGEGGDGVTLHRFSHPRAPTPNRTNLPTSASRPSRGSSAFLGLSRLIRRAQQSRSCFLRPYANMGYPLRLFSRPRPTTVEITQSTTQFRFLLRPEVRLNERIVGAMARAQELYPVHIHAFAFLSQHFHILATVDDPEHMAGFMRVFTQKLSKEIQQLHSWHGAVFPKRYHHVELSREPEVDYARLLYVMKQGCKEGLVASPLDWPGVSSAEALVTGEPLRGMWIDRTALGMARNRGQDVCEEDFGIQKVLHLEPIPFLGHLSPAAYRRAMLAMVRQVEEETSAMHKTRGTRPLGVEAILNIDPRHEPVDKPSSPRPWFHAINREARRAIRDALLWITAAYRAAAERLKQGDRSVSFPENTFPPGLPFVRSTPDPAPG